MTSPSETILALDAVERRHERRLACARAATAAFGQRRATAAKLAILGAVGLFFSGLAEPCRAQPEARVLRSLCRPAFVVDGHLSRNGTGFLLAVSRPARRTYLLVAQHLISVPPPEMPQKASAASCRVPSTDATFSTGPAYRVEGAHPMGALSTLKDVAVFPVTGPSPGLPLALADVSPGQAVWLMAQVKGGADAQTQLHRARVVRSEGFLAYSFDDRSLNLDQTSGGAVLNGDGEVVGLNVGYTRMSDGELVGVADRLSTLQQVVRGLP